MKREKRREGNEEKGMKRREGRLMRIKMRKWDGSVTIMENSFTSH